MIEIAALLLCKIGGKAGSADDIKAVLEAAGAPANDDEIAKLTGDLDGKDINELLSAGAEKVKDIPLGGGGGGSGGGGGGGAAGAAEEAKEEEPEEEEEAPQGAMGMFGDDAGMLLP